MRTLRSTQAGSHVPAYAVSGAHEFGIFDLSYLKGWLYLFCSMLKLEIAGYCVCNISMVV